MIVDDAWAEIGSMNCNRRSMTHDAEVSVAVVDSAIEEGASKFARNLRLRLWAEHLNLDPSDASIGVPLQGFHQWKTRAGCHGVPAVAHTTAKPPSNMVAKITWDAVNRLGWSIADPSGVCREADRILP